MIEKTSKIYIAGHQGMVGSAMRCLLERKEYSNVIYQSSKELDLTKQDDVDKFIEQERPDYIFLFAAKVGGIKANIEHPAEFLYDNLLIETNVINTSYKYKIKKLLFLGSSCVYPRECPQPMKEKYLLSGKLEPTNEGYALSKIAGLKLCEYYNKQFKTNFICLMPPNLYGLNDNFDINSSHVIAGLIRKFVEAKVHNLSFVEVWGRGEARREFLYAEDLADACFYFMDNYDAKDLPPFINIGYGEDISVKELVYLIKDKVGYKGEIKWKIDMPEGMPQKLLDITLAKKYGWKARVSLEDGVEKAIKWYMQRGEI